MWSVCLKTDYRKKIKIRLLLMNDKIAIAKVNTKQ